MKVSHRKEVYVRSFAYCRLKVRKNLARVYSNNILRNDEIKLIKAAKIC